MSFNTKKLVSIIVSATMLFSLSGFNVLAEEAVDEESIMVNEAIVEEANENNAVEETEEATEIEMIETTVDLTENIENNYVGETINSNELTVTSTVAGDVIIDEYNGMGTEQYPYKIRTAEQFMSIGTKGYVTEANGRIYSWGAYYILMNDIEVSSDDYIPIGNNSGNFTGTFDGDGHTIYFTYNGGNYQGLFGVNSGTIKNLTVSGDVTGGNNFGMLVGENKGIIENCFTSGTVSGGSYVGGMVGLGSGTITASGSDATVTGTSNVGGLVGEGGTILNSYALGNVSHINGGGSKGFGGLVGGSPSLVKNCYALGEVCGGNGGGLVGTNIDSDPHVYNSYYHSVNKLNRKGFPVSAEELRDKSTFYMWDFENVWTIDESGYPYINLRGETPEVEFDGEGTEKNPYLIETEEQLYTLAMKEKGIEEGLYYRLENDIEITAKYWTPINSYNTSTGIFDGNGHTISGIKISGINKRIGLFANNGINGVIKNLTVSGNVQNEDGTYYWGDDATGILVGYNRGTVEHCFSSGTAEGEAVGGLIGISADGAVRYCGSDASITSDHNGGGLIGENAVLVLNCYAQGDVVASDLAGGLIGSHSANTAYARNIPAIIKYCYASGMVNNGDGGGLTGSDTISGSTRIYNSYYHCANTKNCMGFPATADELKDKNNYYMWDFENVWAIDESGYPYINLRGETPAVTFEGDGDADSPYLIKTEKQLYALSMDEASIGSGIYYKLANDIEVTAKYWTPIKIHTYGSAGFSGVFDGNGYTISGIRNNTLSGDIGLFGYNGGTIKNLKVSGDFDAVLDKGHNGNVGILVAENQSGAVVENCYSEGTAKGNYNIGGLVGVNYGTVKESGSAATVEGKSNVGGLVGDNASTIINSYAQGDVTSSADGVSGGLAGNSKVIKNCYSTGLVNGGSGDCLVGTDSTREESKIYNSYTINTNNSSNNQYAMNGFIVSEEELKDKSTYYMWDFDNIWAIDEGGYPYINKRGETPAVTFEGDGDADSPYLIKTEEQLHALAMGNASVADGIHYQLANNIELTAKYWTPICMYDEFKATFDGNGFTVSGVKSSLACKWVGLFGKNNGTIKNLNVTGAIASPSNSTASGGNALLVASNKSDGVIEGCSATGTVKGADKVGVLVSENYGIIKDSTASGEAVGNDRVGLIAGYNNKTVENCVASGAAEGKYTIGGLVGENTNNGSITGSGAEATVKGVSTIGGLAGYSDGKITDCYARGSVTATGDNAGGLVGRVYNSNATISNSNSISEVSGDENVGGLVGFVGYASGKIDSCFAKGTATGTTNVGGLVGLLQGTSLALSGSDVDVVGSSHHVGGLVGKLYYASIDNSYAHGDVSGTGWGHFGGLVGYNDNSAVEYCYATGAVTCDGNSKGGLVGSNYGACTNTNSYYDTETSGMSDTDKGIGMTTAQMKDATSYEGWDFADTWAISNDTNDGYPYLRALTPDFGRGDVNGDKSIDNKDATYLLRYLADWTIPGLAQEALDVDGSDEVDNKDATILLRYLAGWDITLN